MENDHRKRDAHDEKMVTVAIHTYEKAHILKTILESEGIPAVFREMSACELTKVIFPGLFVLLKR